VAQDKAAQALDVWMNGERVGRWSLLARGQHEFNYDDSWLAREHARPLSISMPLGDAPYRGALVESYFDNLLPDSEPIRARARSRFGAESTRAFDLLAEIGRDCVGAVQLLKSGEEPPSVREIRGKPQTRASIANLLRANVTAPALGQRGEDEFRISIAGAQEKTALLWHEGAWNIPRGTTPTTHIFKQPLGRIGENQVDLSTSVENEWLCAEMVREFGQEIAACQLDQFEDQRVLIVERFDRRLARDQSWWMRLPQEDLCQATMTSAARKYESDGGPGIERIMDLLLGSITAPVDRRRFLEAQILFWMMCAIDGHAKNFSLTLEPHGRFRLTPLYDVLSAYPVVGTGPNKWSQREIRMAMAVSGKHRHYKWDEIRRRHWQSTARKCGLASEIEPILADLVARTPGVIARVSASLPDGFPTDVSDSTLAGLEAASRRLETG
jgi:serine/threonine-protein kinase HipA